MTFETWLPTGPEGVTVDPEQVARRILASLDLEAPEIGIHPRGEEWPLSGIVGWNAWLWAPGTWEPISASETEAGVRVSLTAQIRDVVWDMGNGDTLTCGQGTPWSAARTNGGMNVESPTCGYLYEARGDYTVTVTSRWNVEWSGGGESGTLPLELSRDRTYLVRELQSVNIPNGG